jgi:hypothetical protein
MKQTLLLAPIAALALASAPALAGNAPPQREASIAFADHGGVDDWRAEGDHAIYFKDQHRRWYRAELFGPCFDLPYVEHIGIDARPSGTLDKFGAIYVRGQRCAFRSFEQVPGPPSKHRHGRNG